MALPVNEHNKMKEAAEGDECTECERVRALRVCGSRMGDGTTCACLARAYARQAYMGCRSPRRARAAACHSPAASTARPKSWTRECASPLALAGW